MTVQEIIREIVPPTHLVSPHAVYCWIYNNVKLSFNIVAKDYAISRINQNEIHFYLWLPEKIEVHKFKANQLKNFLTKYFD